ncbi:MAG: alpha-amylase [Erysipelotrichaceae bacterium]
MNTNGVIFQYFEWYLDSDHQLWKRVAKDAAHLKKIGISSVYLPPAYKGNGGDQDVGYGVYDVYDLGEFNQKGSIPTKYGTKKEYLKAIAALHKQGIEVYADIVLNHKMGADETEMVPATKVSSTNRNFSKEGEGEEIIEAWTKFNFPGRNNQYSDFTWNWTHFDGIDYDAKYNRNGIYRFYGKTWALDVNQENHNYDYLMGVDIDFKNREVVEEMIRWGKWYLDTTQVDGLRLDALKHISSNFYVEWLKAMREYSNKELFTVGEYWSADVSLLLDYLTTLDHQLSLFDVPLHFHFREASNSNGQYNMANIFENTLVEKAPQCAVTFVDNHDTQNGQSLSSEILAWFKPLAYAMILLRKNGYPCIFYGDYYGIAQHHVAAGKDWLDVLLQLRCDYAYGEQVDYFDDFSVVGWVRLGDDTHQTMVCILSDSDEGSKAMKVKETDKHRVFYDCYGGNGEVIIDESGYGEFRVSGGSLSIYIPK